MGMIFKENMGVLITRGRLANKKAVILKVLDEKTILVGGINRLPSEPAEYMAAWEKRRCAKFLTFIKKINIKHVIATRYGFEENLGSIDVSQDLKDVSQKADLNKKVNEIFKKAYENNKSNWVFTDAAY